MAQGCAGTIRDDADKEVRSGLFAMTQGRGRWVLPRPHSSSRVGAFSHSTKANPHSEFGEARARARAVGCARGRLATAARIFSNNTPTTCPEPGRLIRSRSMSVRCRSRKGECLATTGWQRRASVGQGRSHGLISGGSDPSRAESSRGGAIGPRPLLQSKHLTGVSTGQPLITRRSHHGHRASMRMAAFFSQG